ncbi:hypothetical protein QOZ80_7AG0554170 [Eleusine coracana subsp. coracana]|nr:hypothetical protein QOZ80_7AG0554170 [Eleusine coracana subsp. coracana]
MGELVEEILLRFPPDDPGSLLSTALVCKAWCRLVSGPGFNRRFREFHHQTSPPVLGFLCTIYDYESSGGAEIRFVPTTTSFRRLPHAAFMPNWRPVDARHGRILFYDLENMVPTCEPVRLQFIVWNSIAGEASRLPLVPMYTQPTMWNAALLCDHDPFRVVLVASVGAFTSACIYSSKQHLWSTPISAPHPRASLVRGSNALSLIGSALYFMCRERWILEYDMSKQELSLITMPLPCNNHMCIALMNAEDGGLGFAVILQSNLYTWSRVVGLDGAGIWAQQRVFGLNNLLRPFSALLTNTAPTTRVVAAENDLSVIFKGTCGGLFVIDLKFGRLRKICDRSDDCNIRGIVPYASFYILHSSCLERPL